MIGHQLPRRHDEQVRAKSRERRRELRRRFRFERGHALRERARQIFRPAWTEDLLGLGDQPQDLRFFAMAEKFFTGRYYHTRQDREDIYQSAWLKLLEGVSRGHVRDPEGYFLQGLRIAQGEHIESSQDTPTEEELRESEDITEGVHEYASDPFLRPAGAPEAPHNSTALWKLSLEQQYGNEDAELLWELVENTGEPLGEIAERLGFSRRALKRRRDRIGDRIGKNKTEGRAGG